MSLRQYRLLEPEGALSPGTLVYHGLPWSSCALAFGDFLIMAVRVLLAHGADPNTPVLAGTKVRRRSDDFYLHGAFVGVRPFWLAARFSQPNVMRLLAEHGADPLFEHYVSIGAAGTEFIVCRRRVLRQL